MRLTVESETGANFTNETPNDNRVRNVTAEKLTGDDGVAGDPHSAGAKPFLQVPALDAHSRKGASAFGTIVLIRQFPREAGSRTWVAAALASRSGTT